MLGGALRPEKAFTEASAQTGSAEQCGKGSRTYGNLDEQNGSEYELCNSYHCILTVDKLMTEKNGRVCVLGEGADRCQVLFSLEFCSLSPSLYFEDSSEMHVPGDLKFF